MMVMRVGGLASGIDIEAIVDKLMSAERIPLNKLEQDRTKLEWKRDAFREINSKLTELDKLMIEMKKSRAYNAKSVSSSLQDAVTATANADTANGTYQIKVNQLASTAINVSKNELTIKPTDKLTAGEKVTFNTVNEKGETQEYTYEIQAGDTLSDVLKKISRDDNNVRMFYDESSNKVIMETTKTGNYRDGAEIQFAEDSFLADVLQMDMSKEKGGTNAKFEYNNSGLEMESKTNSYKLDDKITFEFKQTTDGKNASLTVTNDVEASYEKIMKFVDKYNEVVEALNSSQLEERYRDFPPLTEEQKKDMSENEIQLWEERAKSGLLRGDTTISGGLFNLRSSWYAKVETGGEYTSLTQVGIETSKDYLDGGKLIVNEGKLKSALRENPADVQKLFTNSDEGESRGLVQRLEDALEDTKKQIGKKAGSVLTPSLESYTLGKRMKEIDERIEAFETRLTQVETRYWNQFTAMEKAISRMNQQSAQLLSQFGGGM
ncbi:flagellar hook-associated protein 2 [Virgibacillus pantothenticus]|uniref:flagellar hook-associated protein 2 n=1 Tax=Virgibacillus pantothenticus TaxID=1473 RepID=UPI002014CCCC|nr:flagellar hook-associated protein 2 [Virgibacillus pantothenticus]